MTRRRSLQPTPLSLVAVDHPSEVIPPPQLGPRSHASAAHFGDDHHEVAPLLDVTELATILRVTPAAVYALVGRGHVPRNAIFRVGRLLRFRRDAVEAWLGSHGESAGKP